MSKTEGENVMKIPKKGTGLKKSQHIAKLKKLTQTWKINFCY